MTRHTGLTRREYLQAGGALLLTAAVGRSADVTVEVPAPSSPDDSVLTLGAQKHLFCDPRLIPNPKGISITLNQPRKLGPVLKPDRPWEDFRLTSYFTVVQDGALARMYYSCFSQDQWNVQDAWKEHAYLCYAESKDGIHWEKPDLGLVDFDGSRQNNILARSIVDGTVFIDPAAPPERRYKMLHTTGPHERGLFVSHAADGIHFTFPDEPVVGWRPDSQQNVFYDARLRKYVAYLRARPDMGLEPKNRSVARVELDHIDQPWPKITPDIVFAADSADPSDVDFYTNACVAYPDAASAYFMFPAMYHHFPKEYGNDGLLDSSIAFSSDGKQWQRPDRRPYVPLGRSDEWDSSFIMMGVGLFRIGDSIYQYYNGTDLSHGGTRKESKNASKSRRQWGWMAAVQQRLDGFYSADAAYAGGEFTTPPLTFEGRSLRLNLDTSAAGSATVAVLDAKGNPIDGFADADCDLLMANDVAKTVTWRGKDDLSALQNRPVRLRFRMRACKLYAMQFCT